MEEKINVGIVGAVGRGKNFNSACASSNVFKIHAVCDINKEKLEQARVESGAVEKYSDYEEMLEESDLQAVIIGTPMPFHASQAIAALNRNIHVLSEVPAGVSIAECKELVRASKSSSGIYMMAENYTYRKENVLIRNLVHRGFFGECYYAEAEYLHKVKALNEVTVWRRKWQTGINGITYGTHSLGPILQWMPEDRVVSVCCAGSGHHYRDPRGNFYENEDSCVMLCKMAKGGLVKIRVDMLSDRPHAMTNYSLQGTDGAYESARSSGEKGKIWLRSLSKNPDTWTNIKELEKDFLPDYWLHASEEAVKAGHGGGDYFEVMDFADVITGKKPCPIGIHQSMDMTLPGLISQKSIAQKGCVHPVPDSRTW